MSCKLCNCDKIFREEQICQCKCHADKGGESWEDDLRHKVCFDSNQDREVCILFIRRLITETRTLAREEVLDELKAKLPDEKEKGTPRGNQDESTHGYNAALTEFEKLLSALRQSK